MYLTRIATYLHLEVDYSPMSTVLIIITDNNVDEKLFKSAEKYVSGTETNVIVSKFIDEEEHESELQRKIKSDPQTDSFEELEEKAERDARQLAESLFEEEVEYTAIGTIGTLPDSILQFAEEKNCEQIFVTGRQRSPTGKIIFGDIAQSIILGFDGPVTVTTE